MINIALIGYGQMGRMIDNLAAQNDCEIVAKIDPQLKSCISKEALEDADVCIEFTSPDQVVHNVKKLSELKKNIVIGTTGWQDSKDKVQKLITKNDVGLVYGSNFSIGMNLFFKIIEQATKIMNVDDYDPYGLEMHHNKKKDSPSGTAKVLSEIILKNINSKTTTQFEKLDRKIRDEEFHFTSVRSGNIPGTHLIGFDSAEDIIELKHTARNREGLALGAIKAAKWIYHKKGCFNFKNVIDDILMNG